MVLDAVLREAEVGLLEGLLDLGEAVQDRPDAVGCGPDLRGGEPVDLELVGAGALDRRGERGQRARQEVGVGRADADPPPPRPLSTSSTVESAMSRPFPMMTTRSAMSCISLMRWLETRTVRPSSAKPRNSERTHRTPSRSRPLTGSSKSSTPGSPTSAAAMPSRCRMPSE